MLRKLWAPLTLRSYIKSGTTLGDMLSYAYMEAMGFEMVGKQKAIFKFLKLEKKIYDLGYLPLKFNDFIAAGGYGRELPPLQQNISNLPYEIDDFLLFEATQNLSPEEKKEFYLKQGVSITTR